MAKVNGSSLMLTFLWIGFLEGNLERGFFTTLGLVLPRLAGIFSADISIMALYGFQGST